MFNLKLDKEPFWIDLPMGVRFHVKPATPAIMLGARYKVSSTAKEPDGFGEITSNLIAYVGEIAVIGWDGVGNEDGGPLPCTPENVVAVLQSSWQIAEEFDKKYLSKFYEIDNEKNV